MAVLLAAVVAFLYAHQLIEVRDTALSVQRQQIADLTTANLALQDQLRGTKDQVTSLTAEKESLEVARQKLVSDLGVRTSERDQLAGQMATLQQQTADLQRALDDTTRQLGAARNEGASQQTRAQSAEARNQAIAAVLQLDNQIYDEFVLFLRNYDTSQQAFNRRDYITASAAYARAQVSGARIQSLFEQRRVALAQL